MVDNVNPNTQFHPYQPQNAVPQTGAPTSSGLSGILSRFGIDQSKLGALGNTNLSGHLTKARGMAQKNPGMVLGGLAALAIGAGLMRRRSFTR